MSVKSLRNLAEVLLPGALSHGFSYLVPDDADISPGRIVRVPFGRSDSCGVVWGAGTGDVPAHKLKPITEILTHLPLLKSELRAFIDWVSWYTASPKGAVLKMALPVMEALNPLSARERPAPPGETQTPGALTLSAIQKEAAEALKKQLTQGFSVSVLDGVTGSGKTEVYFDAIAKLLGDEVEQSLVLLPEIALSVQWLERFSKRFGFMPHVWHSGLTPAQRKHTWRAIVQGSARVVVGARSALFLPFANLKLLVVDEEHDGSYKQEDGVIYHARDMAVARAQFEKIACVLASATPSLETWHNVHKGKYRALTLADRHGGAKLPDIGMIDMRSAVLERETFIAPPLREALAENLANGQQAMLFLNRRGYAPLVLCRKCGHRFECPSCSAWMVLHRRQVSGFRFQEKKETLFPLKPETRNLTPYLQCHHCGHTANLPSNCPACQAEDTLHACGPGVERVAEEVAQFLPQARIAVLASDNAESLSEIREVIGRMQQGGIDILIGTQMIAKGHHFPQLTLVGIVDGDLGLGGGDPRAGERSFQLLHQISGRAGRETAPGRVLIQSFDPTHPVMQALLAGDRDAFVERELFMRERYGLPPFSRLAAVIVDGMHEEQVSAMARELAQCAPRIKGMQLLGPAPAPFYRLRNRFRYRLLLKAERQINLSAIAQEWVSGMKIPSALRVRIDIDPQSFL